ncbi:MAG TPA: nitroreductase family protein [Anaerolinea sp.]|nr:nitroreductase family protein [Anaerolinea sp.]
MTVLDTIFQRRSIREYADRAVPREVLVDLLRAAMAAPSAVNKQPWEFVVVTRPERMVDLQAVLSYGRYNAPAAVVVCGVPEAAQNEPTGSYWVQDCSAATENLLIAAVGLGLGTVWTGVYPVAERVRDVQRVLGLPPRVVPLGVILVGYPAEEKPARTQYREEGVHWELYSR